MGATARRSASRVRLPRSGGRGVRVARSAAAVRVGVELVEKALAVAAGVGDYVVRGVVVETVTLWRPTGPEELALVEASERRRWPPRLPEQPIFYPVLNEEYATMIARDWNVKQSGAGYVTRFQVRQAFLDRYEVHQVGGKTILEYWIPAEDLDAFNENIVGTIDVVAESSRS